MLSEKLNGRIDATIWPQLYAKASNGKIKTWQVGVTAEEDGSATLWTLHGYTDGKLQLKPKPIKDGKNIGKANATTPYEQAVSEALSTHTKKIEQKKYITEIPTDDNKPDILLPMLAKKLKNGREKYPCMVQFKFNGVRCLAKKISELAMEYTSRNGLRWTTLEHLTPHLLQMMRVGEIFDGEIYRHGWGFQKLVRRVKKMREDTNQLQFWVYDIADETMEASARNALYQLRIPDNHPLIVKVSTGIAMNMEDIEAYHKLAVRAGYEGTIIRNMSAKYRFDYRSPNLLKKKDFIDEEFTIVGAKAEIVAKVDEETGAITEQKAVVFVCALGQYSQLLGSDTFDVRPRGSVEDRVRWFNEIEEIKGKPLTVRFQERSEENVPIFPVGIAIRDYE